MTKYRPEYGLILTVNHLARTATSRTCAALMPNTDIDETPMVFLIVDEAMIVKNNLYELWRR